MMTESESAFGHWISLDGLPAFLYVADQRTMPKEAAQGNSFLGNETNCHWVMLGNQRLKLWASNEGNLGVFDESDGLRWIVEPHGTDSGVSIIDPMGTRPWGTGITQWPEIAPRRTFVAGMFMVEASRDGLRIERAVLCPDGAVPWLLIRVRITETAGVNRMIDHREQWVVRPRCVNVGGDAESRRQDAERCISFAVTSGPDRIVAKEQRTSEVPYRKWNYDDTGKLKPTGDSEFAQIFGSPLIVRLEALGGTHAKPLHGGTRSDPLLALDTNLALKPTESAELWFRFGISDWNSLEAPWLAWQESRSTLLRELPIAVPLDKQAADYELTWHAGMLAGGLCEDSSLGGSTLDQGSVYSYAFGFNGAARDPLQHALPLVYFKPKEALGVLRNTCAWAAPNGDLPYALDGAKHPWTTFLQPSDQNLWAMWLAAEYAAVTGDLDAFSQPLQYHPLHRTAPVSLLVHLQRQLRFLIDDIGFGAKGNIRIRNADWNDEAVASSGIARSQMIARGESVLNSAMAAWVLPVFSGLLRKLSETDLALEAEQVADALRRVVGQAWNGRWFDRAYTPNGRPIGRNECWLEVQPWALLCGAASEDQAQRLLDVIEAGPRLGSPLGARVRWPIPEGPVAVGHRGENVAGGGIWFSVNALCVWAASRYRPAMAWDEWRRMTLANHTAHYPTIWEGTLSGPDSYNAPESNRAGRTWGLPELSLSMQSFPVSNLHCHAQPLIAYIRLLGIEPTPNGDLRIGTGAEFVGRMFGLHKDGHGYAVTTGPVAYDTTHGRVRTSGGRLEW